MSETPRCDELFNKHAAELGLLNNNDQEQWSSLYELQAEETEALARQIECELSGMRAALTAAMLAKQSNTRPCAWMKGHITPSSVHGPAEYDVELCYGEDSPGRGWIALYQRPPLTPTGDALVAAMVTLVAECTGRRPSTPTYNERPRAPTWATLDDARVALAAISSAAATNDNEVPK